MLQLNNLQFSYDGTKVLDGVTFSMDDGDIGALIGPSGCGKTTLLRVIAGLERPEGGTVSLQSSIVASPDIFIPAEKRGVGMVFQSYALFPHMTVADNICFPIQLQPKVQRTNRLNELLELVQLSEHRNKYPYQLSGGQQQRVAIARALAQNPRILLMDEPLSNLDSRLRDQLGQELKSLLKGLNVTTLMVTHDQHEAWAMADKIGVMFDGQLDQWGSFTDLTTRPKTGRISHFLMLEKACDICGMVISDTHSHKKIKQL